MLTNLKLRTQLFLVIVVIISIIFAITVLFIGIKSTQSAKESAVREMEQIAQNSGQLVSSEIGMVFSTARSMAQQFETHANLPAEQRRPYFNQQMRYILEQNPRLLGTWTGWEPNALDGLDARFANKEGSDATGRFIPYWNRGNGQIVIEALVDYEKPGAGNFYVLPKKTGKEQIINPYEYTSAQGKKLLMTTLSVPIKNAQGGFLGVAGIDIELMRLKEDIGKIKIYKTGGAFLLGNDGLFAAHPDANAIGKSFESVYPELDKKYAITKAVTRGDALSLHDVSPLTGQPAFFVFNPVRVGETTTPWSLALFAPVAEVMEPVYRNVLWLVMIGVLVLSAPASLSSFSPARFPRPSSRARRIRQLLQTVICHSMLTINTASAAMK